MRIARLPSSLAAFLIPVFAFVGCGTTISSGDDGRNAAGGSGGASEAPTTGAMSPGSTGSPHGIVYYDSAWSTDTVLFGTDDFSCSDLDPNPQCGVASWSARFGISEAKLVPGAKYDLSMLTNSVFSATLASPSPGSCVGGGGTLEGVVEILSYDGASLKFRITAGRVLTEGSIDGEYTATLCNFQ